MDALVKHPMVCDEINDFHRETLIYFYDNLDDQYSQLVE
jgi:hypothetical protein